jgi:type IV pilus assembly protein PilA
MFMKIHKRMKGEKGFTLIELLVVIIIIAILAAIAIPTFLGQRSKAQDASAKSLVRNAMTSLESAYVDSRTYDPTVVLPATLAAIEPSITFLAAGATGICTDTVLTSTGSADSATHSVEYFGTGSAYEITTASLSGNVFGVHASKVANGGTTFVKKISGTVSTGW